jgi:hypothetical protein
LGSYASIYLFFTDPNNNELFIDSTHPITVFVHLENTNINNPQLYRERTNNLLSNTWSSYSDNYNTATGQGENLTITINRTGWYNCGKNLNYLQTNKIAVSLPTNYTNANTLVYAVPNISGSSVQLHPSVSDRQFQSIELPVQGNYKLVVISKQANSYFIAKQDIFISSQPTQGYQYQLVSLNPQITTLGNIKSFLNNL